MDESPTFPHKRAYWTFCVMFGDKQPLKHLAGTESGMGAFTNDIVPEDAATRLRALSQ